MKVLKISYYAIAIALLVWFYLSWHEIAFNHMDPEYIYHSMNLINLMFKG